MGCGQHPPVGCRRPCTPCWPHTGRGCGCTSSCGADGAAAGGGSGGDSGTWPTRLAWAEIEEIRGLINLVLFFYSRVYSHGLHSEKLGLTKVMSDIRIKLYYYKLELHRTELTMIITMSSRLTGRRNKDRLTNSQ